MSKISALLNHLETLSHIRINAQNISIIENDLAKNNPKFHPTQAWMNIGGGTPDPGVKPKLEIENLLNSYLGYAKKVVSDVDAFWYRPFLEDIDLLGVSKDIFGKEGYYKNLTVSDLGFFWDLNLIFSYLEHTKETIKVIEVGGGYGRLAEICQHILPGKIKYYLIDAVPASICLAYEYLTASLPNHKIGSFYENEKVMDSDLDIYILPSWRCDLIPIEFFDLAINIQSMQEMDKQNIDFYMKLFNQSLITDEGLIYLCNRRDHLYKGSWDFPINWKCLQKQISPRSLTREMPAELYEKRSRNFSRSQVIADKLYKRAFNNSYEKQVREAKLKGYKTY